MAESRAPVFRRTETLHRARHRNAAPYVFEQCPGYLGHSGAEIRARHSFQERRGERRNLAKLYDMQLTSAELQELLDRWLSAIYSKHEGLHGATPAASSMSDCSICFSAKMASRLSGPRGFASKARSSGMTR